MFYFVVLNFLQSSRWWCNCSLLSWGSSWWHSSCLSLDTCVFPQFRWIVVILATYFDCTSVSSIFFRNLSVVWTEFTGSSVEYNQIVQLFSQF
jgi:hypothetical protein